MSEESDSKMKSLLGEFNVEDKINYMLGIKEDEEEE